MLRDLVHVDTATDVRHRVLLARLRRGDDPQELAERTIGLLGGVLRAPGIELAGRVSTQAAHRRLAGDVRDLLAEDRDRSLPALARTVGTSPHHLSRVFAAATGITISEHRRRLRTREALERIAAGERDLAGVAAAAGFADHSHLVRVLRQQTGHSPSALRSWLAAPTIRSRRAAGQ